MLLLKRYKGRLPDGQPEDHRGRRGTDVAEIEELGLHQFAADIGYEVRDHL